MRFRQTAEISAEPQVLFDLTQDYSRRLSWDPFLKEARLVGEAQRAGLGVRAWCVARNGFGMETEYVSYNPPDACAVKMTRGPWFLLSFAGSWRFRPLPQGKTLVTFTYHLLGWNLLLTWLIGRVMSFESKRRLAALNRAAAALSTS